VSGAVQRQAFSSFSEREPEQDAPHYCPDRNQIDLFQGVSPETAVKSRADHASESLHADSVSSAANLRGDPPRNVHGAQDRNLRSVLDQVFPDPDAVELRAGGAPIDTVGTNDFTEICGDALYVAFGTLSAPIKRIAQVANVNERTAKNWWEKKCAPGPIHTLRLMAHVPEFQGRMRELTAMEAELDPALERSMMETIRLMQQRGFR
jgi:hypothetical protein